MHSLESVQEELLLGGDTVSEEGTNSMATLVQALGLAGLDSVNQLFSDGLAIPGDLLLG